MARRRRMICGGAAADAEVDAKAVYAFERGRADGRREMLDLLGSKGSGLHEMARRGLNVPPGFTLSTACNELFVEGGVDYVRKTLMPEVLEALSALERTAKRTMFRSGCTLTKAPLLLSVRSGAAASMPGMMDTVLNLGMNDECVAACVAAGFDERWIYDSYRRLISMFGDVIEGIPKNEFEAALTAAKTHNEVRFDSELSADALKKLCAEFKSIYVRHGKVFEQDVTKQLTKSIVGIFESWNNPRAQEYRELNRISGLRGTAVNVQMMVFGNWNDNSGAGVCFSRNPADGSEELYGEFLVKSQGEDVVSGVRTPMGIEELSMLQPKAADELSDVCRELEEDYRDMMDLEFTVEDGTLFILQCRKGKRTATAAVRIATEMASEGIISRDEALLQVNAKQLERVLHPVFVLPSTEYAEKVVANGLPASPGAAVGAICFTAKEAKEMKAKGTPCILVREETCADDVGGMFAADGVLTARGGMTSHAAVVARGWGKPCVSGCTEMTFKNNREIRFGASERTYRAGHIVSINGSTGEVVDGQLAVAASTIDTFLPLKTFMVWADEKRRIGVRANADTPDDAALAVRNGAEGIGLVRTEHMFFETSHRLDAMREFIISQDEQARKKALEKLETFQTEDFRGIFKAAEGLPVTMRLIDPPLHEFLPSDKQMREGAASEMARYIGKSATEIMTIAESIREKNPMLGFRGCRVGIVKSDVTKMQTRAFVKAAMDLASEGFPVHPEVMIPLVSTVAEFHHQRDLIWSVVRDVAREHKQAPMRVPVGTMIETCRSALIAGDLAKAGASFFSFGTNDLTQMTYGFSRDDSAAWIKPYIDMNILSTDPFIELDDVGVAELMRTAIDRARDVRPDIELGVCGEHGGDPSSIRTIDSLGVDYVSCSPARVLVARLAAAQAAIRSPKSTKHFRRAKTTPAA